VPVTRSETFGRYSGFEAKASGPACEAFRSDDYSGIAHISKTECSITHWCQSVSHAAAYSSGGGYSAVPNNRGYFVERTVDSATPQGYIGPPKLGVRPDVQRHRSRHALASAIHVDDPCWRGCYLARRGSTNPIPSRTQG
jgi:hypothetical protein